MVWKAHWGKRQDEDKSCKGFVYGFRDDFIDHRGWGEEPQEGKEAKNKIRIATEIIPVAIGRVV